MLFAPLTTGENTKDKNFCTSDKGAFETYTTSLFLIGKRCIQNKEWASDKFNRYTTGISA